MTLKLQFSRYSKKPNQSIYDYLSSLTPLADSLTTINCPVTDKDIAIQALNGLPFEYDAFVADITHLPQAVMFQGLRAKLPT